MLYTVLSPSLFSLFISLTLLFLLDGKEVDRLSESDEKTLSGAEILICDPGLIVKYNLLPPKLPALKYMQATWAGIFLMFSL